MVRRILRKYGYPPDLQAEATKLVLGAGGGVVRGLGGIAGRACSPSGVTCLCATG